MIQNQETNIPPTPLTFAYKKIVNSLSHISLLSRDVLDVNE